MAKVTTQEVCDFKPSMGWGLKLALKMIFSKEKGSNVEGHTGCGMCEFCLPRKGRKETLKDCSLLCGADILSSLIMDVIAGRKVDRYCLNIKKENRAR